MEGGGVSVWLQCEVWQAGVRTPGGQGGTSHSGGNSQNNLEGFQYLLHIICYHMSNILQGSYSVLLPDGRRQLVSYTVTGQSGFLATVSYEDPSQSNIRLGS